MRYSKTLAKWRAGQPIKMCALGNYLPAFVRHAAHFGFDAIWIDAEHRDWQPHQLTSVMALCSQFDIDAMVRPPTLEKTRLYRYLEDGATGLMIPHVSTAEKARMLVDAVKFPPLGDRGQDGAGFDADYLLHGGRDYVEFSNQETFLVVQIETPQAVDNVEEIAAVPGVDALFVGTGDLGMRIRRTKTSWTLEAALQRVADAAANTGKIWGAPGLSPDNAKKLFQQGARMIPLGDDFTMVMNGLESAAHQLTGAFD